MPEHHRPKKQSEPLDFPGVPPQDEILDRRGELGAFVAQMNEREGKRRRNGSAGMRTTEAKAKRAALFAQIEQLPPDPLTEYVLNDDGRLIPPAR